MSSGYQLYWEGQNHKDLDRTYDPTLDGLVGIFLTLSVEVENKYDIGSEFSLYNEDPLRHGPSSEYGGWGLTEDVVDAAERLVEGVRKRDPLLLEAASAYAPDPPGNVEEQHWEDFERVLRRFIQDVQWASDNGARFITFDMGSVGWAVDRANPDTAPNYVTSEQRPLRVRFMNWWTDRFGK